jgi:hypothetical protein
MSFAAWKEPEPEESVAEEYTVNFQLRALGHYLILGVLGWALIRGELLFFLLKISFPSSQISLKIH